jgi:hypothetical protein
MILVLTSGIGIAALCRPTQLAAACLFSAALVMLTISILGALYAPRRARPF